VLLVPEALTALRDASPADPLTPEGLFAATRESVPRHDRARDPNWEATWRERADRLLRWLALVDLAEEIEAGEAGESEARKRVRSPTSPAKRSETPCYGVRQPVRDKPFTRSRRR